MKQFCKLLLFPVYFLLINSCAGTRNMRVEVMRPALITIPSNIKSIAILNRSIPSGKVSLESALTLEKPAQDKELSENCLRGLIDLLNTSNRFQVKKCESTMFSSDPKSLSFGLALAWNSVDSLCLKYEVDALMVLEYFDTDFSVLNPGATAANTIGNVLNGNQVSVQVTGTAKSFCGYRVYYSKTKSILYEDRFDYKKTWTQNSSNPIDAVSKLIKKNDALYDVSYETGQEFAMKVIPLYYWENRDMYKGKKGDMERGERQAIAKDWEGAFKTWVEVYEMNNKNKIRAIAAFNAALACEVLGKLYDAQIWIQRAYIEDGKEVARNYSDIIDYRLRQQAKLKEQTEE